MQNSFMTDVTHIWQKQAALTHQFDKSISSPVTSHLSFEGPGEEAPERHGGSNDDAVIQHAEHVAQHHELAEPDVHLQGGQHMAQEGQVAVMHVHMPLTLGGEGPELEGERSTIWFIVLLNT